MTHQIDNASFTDSLLPTTVSLAAESKNSLLSGEDDEALLSPDHSSSTSLSRDMGEVVIQVDHVWKRFARNEYRPSLRHEAASALKRIARLAVPKREEQPFYALKDVSFKVMKGESLAVVGRNGSGKSTLLRLLSNITQPTIGQVSVRGRYASLIALGAGFSPEMTGRSNIFLNAAIQGVAPKDVKPIVEEIIDFAQLGDFIDLPVKRYSSGMYARLGFSISVHILPDIIFLDEVLSVGDAEFQKRCERKIEELKAEGRTFVLVTHGIHAARTLCERAIWLNYGEMMMEGECNPVLDAYYANLHL